MSNLDVLLSIIENPTRRKILEALVREPNYPLQLSKELQMSQQAIMKHLKVLEDSELVRSHPEESDRGGPNRKLYVPTSEFTIIVDVGPGLFNAEIVMPEDTDRLIEASNAPVEPQGQMIEKDLKEELDRLRGTILGIDKDLEDLHAKRASLIRLKEQTLELARRFVENSLENNQVRRIIYESIKRPSLSPQQIGRELGIRDETISDVMEEFGEIGGKHRARE
ncbi:MAG: helix-turn-helix domain-containing protein [Methanomassiliicoccales archaeon]|nr:helix-turn-helix domain-containing protein [Methanomassiliicoccales archaeon]